MDTPAGVPWGLAISAHDALAKTIDAVRPDGVAAEVPVGAH
jgi:hypothetical protein